MQSDALPSPLTPAETGVRDRTVGRANEPIAVIGMACRFPGANDVAAFWRLLADGRNAVTEGTPGSGVGRIGQLFPDAANLTESCRFAAFIDDVEQFDAAFFRVSPVEAQLMDPQQRLMLETSWQAMEDAGIDPDTLRGSRTGVYGGISNNDYRALVLEGSDPAGPAASLYAVNGSAYNTAIGRVAFALGFEGPAIAIDTACSSSLVAIHQAIAGLRQGEADLALAGGVHTILSGRLMELRANAGMLAPDGRCKTFDVAANGYVRGEGCGILVLKRLSEAEADGDRIWGIIRGTALNQDGASTGLTVPSETAQRGVIEAALRRSGVAAAQVDYVEAHGTGTPVGDPIELRAVAAAYGVSRPPEQPLLIGSVKTNFGHLESAAGVAAVMKVLLAMRHGTIPKHRNFRDPTPAVDWQRLPLRVTSTATDWPLAPDRAPLAGVNGFGWSGTNAHVVLQGYGAPRERGGFAGRPLQVAVSLPAGYADTPDVQVHGRRAARLLPLSGKTDDSLRELAGRYLTWLDRGGAEPPAGRSESDDLYPDMAWTAVIGRSHMPHRAGIVFNDSDSLRDGLRAVADNGREQAGTATRVAFVYTGQGSQWVGMGRILYEREPVFRAVLDRCDSVIMRERGASLLDVMFGNDGAQGDLYDADWAQPAVYALECALTALWAVIGIEPHVVIGHSLGEFAAAQAAGVFSLEDGLRFVARRGGLLQAVPEAGSMAAVFAPQDRVEAAVREHNAASQGPELGIGVYNGTHQVISGPTAAVQAVSQHFESEEVRVTPLRTNQAFHSVLVEPALPALAAAYETVAVSPPSTTLISNVTGKALEPDDRLDGSYWCRHARQAVQFRKGIATVAELGVDLVIEIGPHAVLGPLVSLVWPDVAGKAAEPVVLESMVRPSNDPALPNRDEALLEAVAGAYEAGLPIAFAGLFAGEARRRIELPGYPFQRRRHWVETRRRRLAAGHPLLGTRHESPRGEVMFETEMMPSDPSWLADHRVFGRVVMPGALYGAMAAAAARSEGAASPDVTDLQLHSPMVFAEEDADSRSGRRVQVVLGAAGNGSARAVEIFSRGESGGEWTLHASCETSPGAEGGVAAGRIDVNGLKSGLAHQDVAALYRARADAGIGFGPTFRTLCALWCAGGEAIAEIVLPDAVDADGVDLHPLLLDGCFQAMSAARHAAGGDSGSTYLPFGWERLRLAGRLPPRLICHARLRERVRAAGEGPPEAVSGDLRFYAEDGVELGALSGYTVKRATRAALLAGTEEVQDLLYEVVWRDRPLVAGVAAADFLTPPKHVAGRSRSFTQYLADEGVEADDRAGLLADLERLSHGCALLTLERLGWRRHAGRFVEPEAVGHSLGVVPNHRRLLLRLFEMLSEAGVLAVSGGGFVVRVGHDDPLPAAVPGDADFLAAQMNEQYWHGATEIALTRRCGEALADVLAGRADGLSLLFGGAEPTAADLYLKAPMARAANRMLAGAVAALLDDLPDDRRLRVLEVGAGTGSATASILPELPAGRFEYLYTDISAGFFTQAETRLADVDAAIEYRVLDIEKDPIAQGFEAHGYDLVVASNVLHATRDLNETLAHCRKLLTPCGQLAALENLRGQSWLDLTFGQLDGWWRFADAYRSRHPIAGPATWRQALADAGFGEVEVLGPAASAADEPDRGVIVARGPAVVQEPPGLWLLAADRDGVAHTLAAQLAARNQTVVLAAAEAPPDQESSTTPPVVIARQVDMQSRDAWHAVLDDLPKDVPLNGVLHLAALDGHGADGTAAELGEDARHAAGSALALLQGLADAGLTPAKGLWFVTRGGQVVEREREGEPAGALLWGLGKVVAREAPHLRPGMIDLDPAVTAPPSYLVNEFLHPDAETHVAYRQGRRQAARLVRTTADNGRLALSEGRRWSLTPDPGGAIEALRPSEMPHHPLEPQEIRVAAEAAGLNFRDVLRSLGRIDTGLLGRELCGHVLEVGSEVRRFAVGDRVVALGFGTLGSEAVVHEKLAVSALAEVPTAQLATMPTVFVTAALSYDLAKLKAGERVLIHAAAGGVGLAAIQLGHAAGAEVFATASESKQPYLRSLGVKHVFDSRGTAFGQEILAATGGAGVHVVLNSLTGEGFIDASLSCLAPGGRFVELSRVDAYDAEQMTAARPDVAYHLLDLDALKREDPERAGAALRTVMQRLEAGTLAPLPHTRWAMAETPQAMTFMRAARHVGKIVLCNSPLHSGRLREDRTYLVTGGLGGIGCALAGWLHDNGAGSIVLNGRRDPDPEATTAIEALRERGANVRVELADVTDTEAVDAMLARIDAQGPPLAGVIHSVGVLSDAALTNQGWDTFREVLWPKVLGAWHLHRATGGRDLDLFVLFSSVAGVLGNAGQANHAAANAFLDQLAGHRRARGLPAQTIAWGAWSELGEAAEQRHRIGRQLEAAGTGWITPRQGLRAFETMLRHDLTTGMAAAVDWPTFAASHQTSERFLEELLSPTPGHAGAEREMPVDLLSQLRSVPALDREAVLVSLVQKELQAVMRLPTPPASGVGFFDLGMDSLMAVELRNRLNRAMADEYVLGGTVVFDYPDVTTLARHLAAELSERVDSAAPAPAPGVATGERPPIVSGEQDHIAIVGMACRFPGAGNLDAYWRLLESGGDAVTVGRPPGGAGSGPGVVDPGALAGGYVEGIDLFDSRFFRIAPVEARTMDPRQRMMLETTWEALEDAGIDPGGLRGSRTGVYAGIGDSEYRELIEADGPGGSHLGTTASVTAGRVAFALGLEGPAMAIDMACASALAAVHQAVAALRRGEVDLAVAGAANAVLSKAVCGFMAQAGMVSPSGRCRPFDASADGYVRGEGCGIVVLKRLREAEAEGDRIWGVIRGSAVNQNGASAGLTVPSGLAQERVMAAALSDAGVAPDEVDYLEAHATGSQLGDAIEAHAVASVYGQRREPERPLILGTAKSNVGHLEAAAGIAGLIKTVLALKQGVIPKQLHFERPNGEIDLQRTALRLAVAGADWPPHAGRPRRGAVSAFGMSGTNAHVVVEAHGGPAKISDEGTVLERFTGTPFAVPVSLPEPFAEGPLALAATPQRVTRFLPLSAKSDGALRDLARRYLDWLDGRAAETSSQTDAASFLADAAWTAGVGRSHFAHRSAVVFRDLGTLRDGLSAVAERRDAAHEPQMKAAARVAFLFPAARSRWAGAGAGLYEFEPVVREILDRCDVEALATRGGSLLGAMFGRGGAGSDLDDPAWEQPAAYALACALSALWRSVGMRPSVVLGDGVGELAAAQAAGVLGLEDGLRIAMARSGRANDRDLPQGLDTVLSTVSFRPPTLTLVSNVTGRPAQQGNVLDAAYWQRQWRDRAPLSARVGALAELEVGLVVEVGAGAVLGAEIRRVWPEAPDADAEARPPLLLASLPQPPVDDIAEPGSGFVRAAAGAYEAGLPLSFAGLFAGESRRRIALPTYPFQRRRHWI